VRFLVFLSLMFLIVPSCAVAQVDTRPVDKSDQTVSKAALPDAKKTAKFQDARLNFAFEYPADLVAKKLPSADEQHKATAERQPANEDPAYKKADNCTQVVLQAERHDDPEHATGTIAFYGNGRKPEFEINPTIHASVTISELDVACIPQEFRGREDEVASGLALSVIQAKDLKQIDQPLWYDVDKHKVHLAAAMGPTNVPDKDGKQADPTKTRYVAGVATVINGTLTLWMFEANDVDYFNRMLRGDILFGNDKPLPLFPASIGNGERIKPVP